MKLKQIKFSKTNFQEITRRYFDDIIGFARDICGYKQFDPWQEQLFEGSKTKGLGRKKVAIVSCHSSGKTLMSSVLALHRLLCYPQSRIFITSATQNQLKSAFGTTLTMVIENSHIANWFNVTAEEITIKNLKGAFIHLQPWTISRKEAFSGHHCISPCLIADEASAIPPVIFEAFEGNMMHPNSLMLLLGNGLKKEGELFDAFNLNKDSFDTRLEVSALDSSFITKQWIDDMKLKYGEDSDNYRVRVLGKFPINDSDKFVPQLLIESAIKRKVLPLDINRVTIGAVDIGRSHDKSVLVIRQGKVVKLIKEYNTANLETLKFLIEADIYKYNLDACVIDQHGVGAGTYDYLKNIFPEIVFPVSLVNLPQTEKEYFNNRTKWWGLAKEWLKYGTFVKSEFNKDIISEGSSFYYTFDKLGRYQLESKELAAKRAVHSPDHFDAFAYTFSIKEAVIERNKSRLIQKTSPIVDQTANYIGGLF